MHLQIQHPFFFFFLCCETQVTSKSEQSGSSEVDGASSPHTCTHTQSYRTHIHHVDTEIHVLIPRPAPSGVSRRMTPPSLHFSCIRFSLSFLGLWCRCEHLSSVSIWAPTAGSLKISALFNFTLFFFCCFVALFGAGVSAVGCFFL